MRFSTAVAALVAAVAVGASTVKDTTGAALAGRGVNSESMLRERSVLEARAKKPKSTCKINKNLEQGSLAQNEREDAEEKCQWALDEHGYKFGNVVCGWHVEGSRDPVLHITVQPTDKKDGKATGHRIHVYKDGKSHHGIPKRSVLEARAKKPKSTCKINKNLEQGSLAQNEREDAEEKCQWALDEHGYKFGNVVCGWHVEGSRDPVLHITVQPTDKKDGKATGHRIHVYKDGKSHHGIPKRSMLEARAKKPKSTCKINKNLEQGSLAQNEREDAEEKCQWALDEHGYKFGNVVCGWHVEGSRDPVLHITVQPTDKKDGKATGHRIHVYKDGKSHHGIPKRSALPFTA